MLFIYNWQFLTKDENYLLIIGKIYGFILFVSFKTQTF